MRDFFQILAIAACLFFALTYSFTKDSYVALTWSIGALMFALDYVALFLDDLPHFKIGLWTHLSSIGAWLLFGYNIFFSTDNSVTWMSLLVVSYFANLIFALRRMVQEQKRLEAEARQTSERC